MIDAEKAEYEDVLRRLTAKCEELAAENARLRSSENNAHSVLKEIYNDSAASPNVRVLAARAALGHESAPLKPQPAPLELTANKPPVEDLATLVHRRRRRQAALENEPFGSPKYLEWVEREDGTYPADDKPDADTQG
jgi:hypothetical protein